MATGSPDWQATAFRDTLLATLVAAGMSPAAGGIAGAAAQEWKPDKPVEIVATNAPGGGSDRIGRILIKILQERRYVTTPIHLVNKPGAGGSVAYQYVNQHPGNGHFIALGSRALLTNQLGARHPEHHGRGRLEGRARGELLAKQLSGER